MKKIIKEWRATGREIFGHYTLEVERINGYWCVVVYTRGIWRWVEEI